MQKGVSDSRATKKGNLHSEKEKTAQNRARRHRGNKSISENVNMIEIGPGNFRKKK
jgi:hypothetical protein